MKGIRIVVTYNCNIMCSNCRYKCGPHRKGIMDTGSFSTNVNRWIEKGYNDYLIIDGGEPLLHSDMVYRYLKATSKFPITKYVVTNGYWGDYYWFSDILTDLKHQGLKGIIFEYDYFHSAFIEFSTIRKAINVSMDIGLDVFFRATFLSGDVREKEDKRTFEYMKLLRGEFKNARLIFEEMYETAYIYGKSQMINEMVILHGIHD